ncbi:MAG TPA: hypothetical protein VFI12_07700 [Thermomicrobiales bacterium]|jgi:hypothetical protein|nr:hypothetical protein [Thermomicrobiales bacterium]
MSERSEELIPTASVGYTLAMFAEEVQALLRPAGIEARLIEAEDGARSIRAWPRTAPHDSALFAIDDVRISPYQAHIVGSVIRRSFRLVTSD